MSFLSVDRIMKTASPTSRWVRFVCWLRGHNPTFIADKRIWCARCGKQVGTVR